MDLLFIWIGFVLLLIIAIILYTKGDEIPPNEEDDYGEAGDTHSHEEECEYRGCDCDRGC